MVLSREVASEPLKVKSHPTPLYQRSISSFATLPERCARAINPWVGLSFTPVSGRIRNFESYVFSSHNHQMKYMGPQQR